MKKAFWWIFGILLSPVLLFVVLAILLYLPPVQNWAVDKVAAIASENLGMQISVGHVELKFPLDLAIDDVHVDTIADVGRVVVDVQLMPLLDSRVVINELEVSNTSFDTNGFVDAARVKGRFGRLYAASRGIDLSNETVEVNGASLEDANIDIAMNDSVPEDTTTSVVLWKINIDSVVVSRSDIAFHMPGDTMSARMHIGRLAARDALVDLGTQTYTVGSVDWNGGSLLYDQNFEPRTAGLDFNHIDLNNINIGIDSIYYHDPTLRLYMRQVALASEKNGLQITELSGPISMENGSVLLPRFRLKTPTSDIYVEMDMPLSLMDSIAPGKMKLTVDAQIGRQDLMLFMGDVPAAMRDRWPYYPLSISGKMAGNTDYMEFSNMKLNLPTVFQATATGYAANVTDLDHLRADVEFSASSNNLSMVTALLPRDIQRDYRIPPISADGRIKADGQQYSADVTAHEGRGMVKLNGNFNAAAMRYDAKLSVRNLNVHHFMPHDSIYTLTADVSAKGQGTDFLSPRTTMVADAKISHLHYGSWHLTDITAQADVHNGHAYANIDSRNDLLSGLIGVDALINPKRLQATITTDINRADLYAMGFMNNPLQLTLCGHADVTSDMNLTHYVSGLISDIIIRDSSQTFRSEFVGLHIRTDADTTIFRAQSGDMIVKADISGDYEKAIRQLGILADTAMAQLHNKIIDQPALRRQLPNMKLHVQSYRDNPIANLLKSGQGIDFKDLLFTMSTSPVTGVNGNGHIHSLVVSDTKLDTINFSITQRKEHMSFGGQIRNNKKNPDFVFNALFDGVLQERGATFGVRFFDAYNKLGARIGAKAEMANGGISMHLVPERPTLGYKEFKLNKDNILFLGNDGRIRANIDLVADDHTGVKISTEDSDTTNLQDITVGLNRINLAEITSVLPYMPRMGGLLNGDYHIVQDNNGRFSMVGDMAVRNMTYENCQLGNLSTEMMYMQNGDSAHAVEAHLMKDESDIGLLTGTYYDKGDEGALDASLILNNFPLSMVNGFIPDQMMGLEGYGQGELTIKGPLSAPQVEGDMMLDSAYLVSVPYGIRLRFADKPVYISDSKLILEDFTLYDRLNDTPLTVNGNIDFNNLDNILVSLRMRARNYQLIDAKENSKSVAYGKAFVNFFAGISGPMDNLYMRGRLVVLGSTDVSYILRDSPLTTDNQLNELVKFTDLTDSTLAVIDRPALSGFRMEMTVEVNNGAHVMAYMNADHSNYIDLMGGGTLRMMYNPTDGLQLFGKYTLSNGEMKYSLPVIPLKTFTIQDGSYIEFTGEVMNPTLNITATEHTKATVTDESGVGRSVEFDCGVVITKNLSNMGMEFTLDAPEDMQLHSELQAMSVEQRGKLAVSLLTTGMYLSDGNTGGFSMNSALSSFLNSEINSITGNALRTLDLSFGMDNSTDATGETHTDYSFKFAKRFFNNRLKIAVGGKVSTGAEIQQRNDSFFDNVSMEFRLDDSANKYITLFYEGNSYDWLDGYTEKYGGGFIFRRSLQRLSDIFRSSTTTLAPMRTGAAGQPSSAAGTARPSTVRTDSIPTDTAKVKK
ncbi:MAG: translocation/assembly module TamB domain-containing protein [Prevotella sp.]|nr:translocation/assembly module TamB domain-containing protein [Prevotella sp.]